MKDEGKAQLGFVRVLLLLLIAFSCCCATTEPPQVTGKFASSLSKSDVAQIRGLLVTGRHGELPTMTIDVIAADKARVTVSGLSTFEKPQPTGRVVETFTVTKRNGKWMAEGGVEVKKVPTPNQHRQAKSTAL